MRSEIDANLALVPKVNEIHIGKHFDAPVPKRTKRGLWFKVKQFFKRVFSND